MYPWLYSNDSTRDNMALFCFSMFPIHNVSFFKISSENQIIEPIPIYIYIYVMYLSYPWELHRQMTIMNLHCDTQGIHLQSFLHKCLQCHGHFHH